MYVDDVIAIGNPTEREVITKDPDTGRYISYSVLTDDILKPLEVKAVKKGSRYRNMQRQSSLQDKELDYTELGLDASEDLGYTTHFGPSNLAHTRYSLRDGDKGNYILIEELQSDPLQNVVEDLPTFKKKARAQLDTSLGYIYEDLTYLIETQGNGFPDKPINKIKSYIEDVVIPTQLNQKLTREERKNIFEKAVKDMDAPADLIFGDSGSTSNVTFNILSKEFDDIPDEELGRITDSMHNNVGTYIANLKAATSKKDLPVKSITDTIRMSLQAIISDAKAKGINEIVLPPVEKLAEKRFAKSEIAKKIAKGSIGKLIVKQYPTGAAHVRHFRALLNELKLKKNFVPDMIFVDYLNICASSRVKNTAANSYTIIKSIAEELRGLAVEFDVPIMSATQTTRSGYSNTDVGLEDTYYSFGLPATADLMFALISTEELEELNQIMVKQLKNRYNDPTKYKRFVIGIDRAKMKLYDVEESAQDNIMQDMVIPDKPIATWGDNENKDTFADFKV